MPVEMSVDNVDNYAVIHSYPLVTSPPPCQEIPVKLWSQVGFCHLFGEVE